MYVGALQLEQLPFASSYIPTVASQITRAAENAEVASLEPWYRSGGYAIEVEAVSVAASLNSADQDVFNLDDGTNSNRALVRVRQNNVFGIVVTGGAVVASKSFIGASSNRVRFRVAVRIRSNDFALSVDGAAAQTDTSMAMPQPASSLRLGSNAPATAPLYGWIRDFKYVTDPVLIASDYTNAELANRSAEYAS